MKEITKKQFEELLNKTYGLDTQKWGNGNRAAQKRAYGTYLRSSDKEYFDIWYEQYVKTGELE